MNRPELVNEFMLDVALTKDIKARDDAVFDYIQELEFRLAMANRKIDEVMSTLDDLTVELRKKPTV